MATKRYSIFLDVTLEVDTEDPEVTAKQYQQMIKEHLADHIVLGEHVRVDYTGWDEE